ncbi:hypothetical protein V1T76_22495 [Roseibium sp. FZY0029]|uniref:hypothetical protein n=1 Tax=Roseibium sp. FZY0029 TaxID=3116647 RepID=UPI002EB8528C|nr:hypothetical protein [Roseibium sp. FZY0029]
MRDQRQAQIEQNERHSAAQGEAERCQQATAGEHIGKQQFETRARRAGKYAKQRDFRPKKQDGHKCGPAGLD